MRFFHPIPHGQTRKQGSRSGWKNLLDEKSGIQTPCRDNNVNPGSPGCSDENQILALGSQIRLHLSFGSCAYW